MRIASLPPGASVTREWLLDVLPEAQGETSWVGIGRATEISGMTEGALRSAAPRWAIRPSPPVRVTKKNPDNPRSHWLYHEPDLWKMRRERGVSPELEEPDEDTDLREATRRLSYALTRGAH